MFEDINNKIDYSISKTEFYKMFLDSLVEIETIAQLLVQKKIITTEELKIMRERVKNLADYKEWYEFLEAYEQKLKLYKKYPDKFFNDILRGKSNEP